MSSRVTLIGIDPQNERNHSFMRLLGESLESLMPGSFVNAEFVFGVHPQHVFEKTAPYYYGPATAVLSANSWDVDGYLEKSKASVVIDAYSYLNALRRLQQGKQPSGFWLFTTPKLAKRLKKTVSIEYTPVGECVHGVAIGTADPQVMGLPDLLARLLHAASK